jgi:flagellar biosynthesis anti-sigma factor FlgM
MRIPSRIYVDQQSQVSRSQQAQEQAPSKADSTKKAAEQDVRVDVSAQAKELAAKDSIDVEKVEALKASIADGSFQIDAQAIAARIVDQE